MIVVSDTSPINYLILIGEIELLRQLYKRVILPKAVHAELTRPGAPETVTRWAAALPEWLEVHEAKTQQTFPGLDEGEREAISLALELSADFVLVDERKGRRVAAEHGLRIAGTLAVLEQAAIAELVDLPGSLERLNQTTFRISQQTLHDILARDRARREVRDQGNGPQPSS